MILRGKNITIDQDWTGEGDWVVLACSKSCDISGECDEIEVSSPNQGSWVEAIAGRKRMTIKFNYLVTWDGEMHDSDSSSLKDFLRIGEIFRIRIRDPFTELSMNVMLKSVQITATVHSLVQGSIQFNSVSEPHWE
jgi:predicted secreted protein